LTEALRGEMARFDIDVLLVIPGLTRSDLGSHLLRNEGRMNIDFTQGMPPKAVAAMIVEALEKNRTESVLGRDCRWMLRVNRFFPGLADRLLARRVRQLYAGPDHPPAFSKGEGSQRENLGSDRPNSAVVL